MPKFTVIGRVFSAERAGIGGLRVQIVGKYVGEDILLATGQTDVGGKYTLSFSTDQVQGIDKQAPDIQVRVYAGTTPIGASDVRYNASSSETLNIILEPGKAPALPSEYETLLGAIVDVARYKDPLRDLQESDTRQDITYLANKTGWDARAVALAALADQFSARTADSSGAAPIPPPFFYALFRAGLPANEDTLYHTDAKTLESVWNKAAEQGVIPKASAGQIPKLIERFQALSAQKLLGESALVGVSSFKSMLNDVSALNDSQQQKFAALYAAHRTDTAALWEAVSKDPVFGATKVERAACLNRLQVDGKLGFLTINNALLMQQVHVSDPLQLAQMGYHSASKWNELLTDSIPIPKEIPGTTPDEKRTNYAKFLAAQVRLSYPTASVAQMVESGELPLTDAAAGASDKVLRFLTKHQGKFEIDVEPVERYITRKNIQVDGETGEAVEQVKRLQRVYQITPSDQAMIGLMQRGIDAAYHVVRYDKDTFVRSFATDLGGEDDAALTYDRAVQVHGAVLNIALSYLTAKNGIGLGAVALTGADGAGHSGQILQPAPLTPAPANVADLIAYPTLESLFGSMDFCACDHCRSILSPAAYLVDLLLFLDQPYLPAGTNPQDVLLQRRPDIAHLPLTCENTNTALPYIDVVNETLEYFVSNAATLDGYVGHDTSGIASEDLLASPQFVNDAAYRTLRNEHFPVPLPFHLPLERLRRYFNKLEVPLPLAMERLRKSDDLDVDRTKTPPPPISDYAWRDILMEEIGLSRAEHDILTSSTAVPLRRMYGFPEGTADSAVIAGLSNAKLFCRRVGISYDDLIAILKTQFINPNSGLIPKIERLGVSFATLAELKTNNNAPIDAKFDALLADLAVPPDPAEYGGNIKTWVKENATSRIMGLITLTIPAGKWVAKSYLVGDCVRPTAAGPEPTLYYECTTPGTSATAEPNWPTTPGNTYQDNTVVWTCRDASSCQSFDNLAFRYSGPAKITQNIGAIDFIRLLRFIRLWKKLGWTIEQTDAAICALLHPMASPDPIIGLDRCFLLFLPRLGIVIQAMRRLNLTVNRDLLPLLACWSDIGTHGDSALYRQMFLNPALLKQDAVFADNGYGEFFADTTKKLADHAEALRSAFNLTGDEYDRIVAALGYDANTPLTTSNISAIYRRGWLARKLNLSVREFLLLTSLTGLDPFASPDPPDPCDIAADRADPVHAGSVVQVRRRALPDLESGLERQIRTGSGADRRARSHPARRLCRHRGAICGRRRPRR